MYSLQDTLKYSNIEVILRFQKQYGLSEHDVLDVWKETLRWLWLCAKTSKEGSSKKNNLAIDSDLEIIDQMWHTFLLYTQDYSRFCDKYFGMFIHHVPTPSSEVKKEEIKFRALSKEEKDNYIYDKKKKMYLYVYDTLGENVFLKWFKEYPRKYPKKNK